MKGGGKFLVSTTILAVAACGGQDGKLEIRSTPTPLAQGKRPVPFRIAEARGQLAIGNVALALESFRAASREDPNSVDALAGIALCYDQMGRYDLSRRNYEAALALAPSNLELLSALAASLQLQGRMAESLSVRQEIAARSAAAASPAAEISAPIAAMAEAESLRPATPEPVRTAAVQPVPVVRPVTVPAPVAAPVPGKAPATFAAVAPAPGSAAPPPPKPAAPVAVKAAKVEPPRPAPAPMPVAQTAALGPSVTMSLPPARKAQVAAPAIAPARLAEAPGTAKVMPRPEPAPMPVEMPMELAGLAPSRPVSRPSIPEPAVVTERGPRLERVSMGEIALITQTVTPVWTPTTVTRSERSTTVRFIPLREASLSPIKVRLLNAARVNRLAANTRTWLKARGWKGLSIGNATATRSRSLILYPADKKALAQRLSAQFGFPLARRASGAHVTVLLGADANRYRSGRSGRA